MNAPLQVALAALARRPWQALLRVVVVAIAAALLGAMMLFIDSSLSTMTGSAVRTVPVDWQAQVADVRVARRTARDVSRQRDVAHAEPVATATFAGASHKAATGEVQSGAGSILAISPNYLKRFGTVRMLHGALVDGQVMLDQQLAATLQAQVGDTVQLALAAGRAPVSLRVSGIALVTAPEVVFQHLDPSLGPAPAQPPAEIAILPLSSFASTLAPQLPSAAATTTSNVQPGTQAGVSWQVAAQVDSHALTGSPGTALTTATGVRNRVERSLPGRVRFVDNLADALTNATGDALYAEALYIMLALPGALIGLGLVYLASLGVASLERRDIVLLRARGATSRQLFGAAVLESIVIALLAGPAGALLALAATNATGTSKHVHVTAALAALLVGACTLLAWIGILAARIGATAGAITGSIVELRSGVATSRAGRPLWQRLYLDVLALVISGLIFWLTARTGFSAVVNPDSNPTISLAAYMFLAPALLWIGAALLLVRLRGRAVAWLAAVIGDGDSLAHFVLASARRRAPQLNRGLVILSLLLAFGVELGLFTATYDQQARVDAQLTLGSDVTTTAPEGAVREHGLDQVIARVRGVRAVTAVDHDYAYVGPDLQDTYGIDPATFARATSLRDSYFLGGSARAMMDRLRGRADGILVSRETITDYQLAVGDKLLLRVLDRTSGAFRVAPFHVVGIVQEFPSAPKDSFMVTNRSYLERVTHARGPNTVFAATSGDPVVAAHGVRRVTKRYGTTVNDITEQARATTSSITTVSLRGVSDIEERFAILLAAGVMILIVTLAIAERRRELAAMAAIGTPIREIAAFVWSEACIVLVASMLFAALLGWGLAEMLVVMLQHVFDPPPDHLAIPWTYLLTLGSSAIAGFLVATAIARMLLMRLPLGEILREE